MLGDDPWVKKRMSPAGWMAGLSLLCGCLIQPAEAEVSFEWVVVGNAGNELGPNSFLTRPVDYVYRIARHEVSNAQYTAFLNAVDPEADNASGLFNPRMADYGITLDLNATSGSRYQVVSGRANKPVNLVSWQDAARFVNWLENGQGADGTESGTYTLAASRTRRSASATYFLPTFEEWGKAAYHDASAGTAGLFFAYPNGSDTPPPSARPDENPAGANYNATSDFGSDWPLRGDPDGPLADVDAYPAAASPYGTLNQGGNVAELVESLDPTGGSANRMLAGGGFTDRQRALSKWQFGSVPPDWEGSGGLGFRVASAFVASGLAGDFDSSGRVDQSDLDLVLANWGQASDAPGVTRNWLNDWPVGVVDQHELDGVLLNWGAASEATPEGAAVPEPTAAAVLLLLSAARRRP